MSDPPEETLLPRLSNPLFRRAVPGFLALWLAGCAISTPFPRIPPAPGKGADEDVVLVLTHIVVDTGRRAEFDRQTRRVIDSMPGHAGLLGFSARRQIFGNEGWTMSVWASDEARARFMGSAVHQAAIGRSRPAIVTVRIKRLSLSRADLPGDWGRALEMLAQPEGVRVYQD